MNAVALCVVLLCLGAAKPPFVTNRDTVRIAVRDTVRVPVPETIRVWLSPPPTEQSTALTFDDHLWLGGYAAIISFVLAITGKAVGYVIERKRRHHTALVRLEYNFTHASLRLDQSLVIIPWLCASLTSEKKEKATLFPPMLDVDNGPCIDLNNPGLVSKVVLVNVSLDAINKTLGSFESAYADLWDGSMDGTVNAATFRANSEALAEGYRTLEERYRGVRPRIDDLLGRLRVLGEKDRPRVLGWLGRWTKSAEVSEAELKEAIESMRAERGGAEPKS